MSEWQPIETAPKDGTRVLLWNDLWSDPASGHFGGRGWESAYELGPWLHQPTHWTRLPKAPSVQGGGER